MNAEEKTRYDRQVRLWGKATQQQLQQTEVHICGVTPATSEVAKNLVLAGVRSVTLDDEAALDASDLKSNFLLQGRGLGEGRGAAAIERLQSLNPYVSVRLASQTCEEEETLTRGRSSFGVAIIQVKCMADALGGISLPQKAGGIDVVVLVADLGQLTLGMFLFKRHKLSYQEQINMLLTENTSSRPVMFQRSLLLMQMMEFHEKGSFFDRLACAMDIVVKYNLSHLSRRDIELAASIAPQQSLSTAIEATVAGGIITQLIIRELSQRNQSASEDESYSWVVCDNGNGTDIQVGYLHSP